jgi:Lsr2
MARKPANTATAETPDTDAPVIGGLTLTIRRADPITREKREEKPNPLLDYVKASVGEEDSLAFDVETDAQVKEAQNYLRRAATKLSVSLSMKVTDNDNGGYTISFKASENKRARSYTSDEIRTWAKNNGHTVADGQKIPKEIRQAFRVANGFAKPSEIKKAEESANA